ncbi:MAG: helix-turn-helix transcriptional regulator [Bacteroidia bacterium]|nr:helix-turn-helix transcriptional regulator [Bacteroidia bacterium]
MLFVFNVYSSLLLPLVLQGIIFSLLLCWRSWTEDRLADRLLALILLLLTLRPVNWMLGFAHWYDTKDWHTTFMYYFPWNYFLAYGPLAYLYFQSLTNRDFSLRRRDLWHFLPLGLDKTHDLIIILREVVVEHLIQGQPFSGDGGSRGELIETGYWMISDLVQIGGVISVFGYFGWILWQYRQYRAYVSAQFSDTGSLMLSWLRNFLIAFLLTQVISTGFTIANLVSVKGLTYIEQWYSYFAWGLIIYYVSIAGYQAHIRGLEVLRFEVAAPPPEPPPAVSGPAPSPLIGQIRTYMETERPYLIPGLTLAQLAAQLHLPQAELSRAINETGQHFNDFVNQYRIEAVKQALTDPRRQHLSLLGVALDCGFNSKATFNRVFRQFTGVAPGAYRDAQT